MRIRWNSRHGGLRAAAVGVALAALTTACGGADSGEAAPDSGAEAPDDQSTEAEASETSGTKSTSWIMGTAPAGGTYYELGAALSQIMQDEIPGLNVGVRVSAGSNAENARLLGAKEIELGWMSAPTFRQLQEEGADTSALQVVFNGYPSAVHWVTRAEDDLTSPGEFAGQPVAVGNPESGMESSNRELLEAGWGLTFDDFDAQNLHVGPGLQALRDGHVVAVNIPTGLPSSSVLETSRLLPLRLLSLTDDEISAIQVEYPEWERFEISDDTYPDIDGASVTVAKGSFLVAHEDVDQDLIYRTVKAIFENLDRAGELHSAAQQFSAEYAVSSTAYLERFGIPYAEGARRYFEEVGVLPAG